DAGAFAYLAQHARLETHAVDRERLVERRADGEDPIVGTARVDHGAGGQAHEALFRRAVGPERESRLVRAEIGRADRARVGDVQARWTDTGRRRRAARDREQRDGEERPHRALAVSVTPIRSKSSSGIALPWKMSSKRELRTQTSSPSRAAEVGERNRGSATLAM